MRSAQTRVVFPVGSSRDVTAGAPAQSLTDYTIKLSRITRALIDIFLTLLRFSVKTIERDRVI